MSISRHRRQVFLFLAAILVPAIVLVGLASRMIVQDRELSAKHAADQRHIAVDQLSRELDARLEAIKQAEINRQMRPTGTSGVLDSAIRAVVLTAMVDGDRLVLPWESPAPNESPAFARHRQEGETEEFARKDDTRAAEAYRLALDSAGNSSESAEAHLLLARTLAKSGRADESFVLYQNLLNAPADARDEQGVGYRFYAADRLLVAKRESAQVASFLRKTVDLEEPLTLPELYLIRSLLPDNPPNPAVSRRIGQMEQAVALSRDFVRVRARLEAGATSAGPVWVPYGDEPWLVTLTPPQPPLPGLMLAVSSAKVAPPGVKLRSRVAVVDTRADLLGNRFPGLFVEWSGQQIPETVRAVLPVAMWVAGLTLVLGVALFGGYLLLRDVNRDVRVAEVRSQFVASVSHELKTPLTAIRMFAETLAMGRSRDERTKSEYLETIVNESERLARLVDNVLDFSKIEQGRKIYRLRATRLEDVAGSAVRAMQFPLAQQGFHLNYLVREDIPELQIDPDAIQQAILNLLTNAMKYSGDSRNIDLRLSERDGSAVIEVTDRGLGLEPQEQKRVFEKFYRAPSHDSHSIAGTGLGLTLVAHIAAGHGGTVELESVPGAGSTFRILLPYAPIPASRGAVEVRA